MLTAEATEDLATRRVYAHLLIHDPISAVIDAKTFLQHYPNSKQLHLALIRALCERGDEVEALQQWQKTIALFSEEKEDRQLLELLSWGVLTKGESSSQFVVRANALIGAALTNDAKAIPLLIAEMRQTNAMLRAIAVKLCSHFGDAPLQDELKRLLKEEHTWYVRLEVIQAIGTLHITEVRSQLKEIVANPKTLAEEKAVAMSSLVSMYDCIDPEELRALIRSDRAGLRELACEIISYLSLQGQALELLPLLKDSSPDVRASALNTFGLLQIPLVDSVHPLFEDSAPAVAITAGWLALIQGEKAGEEVLEKWIEGEVPEFRRMASAALSITGKKGVPLSYKLLRKSKDPYVRVNLSLGLIGQRAYTSLACETLYEVFSSNTQTLWMWQTQGNPLFRSLAPSKVRHTDQIPHYPVVVDQMVKLELLSVLSVMRYPKALDAVKGLLQTQTWGVTGVAAATLLEEGDEEALALVRQLLNDSDEKIRIQAALMLAILGGERAAVKVLQEAYFSVDREMKVYILEALAHIGDPQSIPFLLDLLKEPFQVLRVVAASALIQCLYH